MFAFNLKFLHVTKFFLFIRCLLKMSGVWGLGVIQGVKGCLRDSQWVTMGYHEHNENADDAGFAAVAE